MRTMFFRDPVARWARMSARRAPSGLGQAGRALWREVNREFGLAAHESAILVQVCRIVDRLDAIEAELAGAELTVPGSTGQPRAHPLLAEWRHQARVLESLSGRCRSRCPVRTSAAGVARPRGTLRCSAGGGMAWRRQEDPFPAPLREFVEQEWPPVRS